MKRSHGPWRRAGDDGDHARALEMEIKGTRRKGHIISHYPCM